MSRDGFDLNDFRDSTWESDSNRDAYTLESFGFGRDIGRGRGGSYDPATKLRLEKLRNEESTSDRAITSGRTTQDVGRPSDSRNSRPIENLEERNRSIYRDHGRSYSLRPSEIHTLTEIGQFRVINHHDLARFAYAGDCQRFESDVRNLVQQGLVERRATSPFKKQSRAILTLTKHGQRLIQQSEFVPENQTIYSGLVKPKEAEHDANLYRLYQRASEEIERKGGGIERVQLDYELKERLYQRLGQARGDKELERLKETFARDLHLPVVQGKVSFPDLRIEYANHEMEIRRLDLELATSHYHAQHLAEKARAGFQIYARPEDTAGLRRVRDEREITVAILSL